MTHDSESRLRQSLADDGRGPSTMGALVCMIAMLALLGGAAFFFTARTGDDIASNQPTATNPMQPPITQQRETTGNANPVR